MARNPEGLLACIPSFGDSPLPYCRRGRVTVFESMRFWFLVACCCCDCGWCAGCARARARARVRVRVRARARVRESARERARVFALVCERSAGIFGAAR